MKTLALLATLLLLGGCSAVNQKTQTPRMSAPNAAATSPGPMFIRPEIQEPWWNVASTPDLGEYNSDKQEPVDFGLWQAADGTWQLWSCIRYTNCGGHTRLFYGWEGKSLTDTDWTPMGIKMESRPELGEVAGGLQAPHVVRKDGLFWMAYGDWNNICFATSTDGKTFERIIQPSGRTALFGEGSFANTRDAMMINIDGLWYCYYTAILNGKGYGLCRTSPDLLNWSYPAVTSYGGLVGPNPWFNESPQVVEPIPGHFVYFRNQYYGTSQTNWAYYSRNPLNFGVEDDAGLVARLPIAAPEVACHEGQYYIASLKHTLDGIKIAPLHFMKYEGLGEPLWGPQDMVQGETGWQIAQGNLDQIFTPNPNGQYNAPGPLLVGTGNKADGTFDDGLTGTILSPVFTLDQPDYYILVSGGNLREDVYVALIEEGTGNQLVRYAGNCAEALSARLFDARDHQGKRVRIKIVDNSTNAWGHINFGGVYGLPTPVRVK